MERRKILLGSGAALATVLAGCSSDETGDESNPNDDDEPLNDDDGSSDGDDGDDEPDIPGLDHDKLKITSDKISIEDVSKDDDKVDIVATTTTTDPDELMAELETLANDIAGAITDPEAFAGAVNSVTWVLENDGAKVMSFYIDVQWAIQYINDELSESEFADRVLATRGEVQ
ncbi:hypothetical protein [Natrinema salifodinae]|uniref:DUF8159 domain-containing protein n=1 Tax=Natrinema salifodinae TaxID=1202768 RepID=A0A1I0PE92_9EURY|nr:hypothetical protein [Natrinema salifodinae]SEW12497.1 hypothetical protein SAMN05216285_2458 [Natrinema salifodinae]